MVELIERESKLELRPDPGCAEDLADCRDLMDALEHHLCNGWDSIDPCECGALTDDRTWIITQEATRDDSGTLTGLGKVYWEANYAIEDALAELQAGRSVFWPLAD
jgi:hypothetical protein